MKIVVTATGKNLDAAVDPRFGRAPFFIVYDTETQEYQTVPNPALQSAHGAGVQAAQMMMDRGIRAVLTGRVGPNAHQILTSAHIEIRNCPAVSVEEAVRLYEKGELPTVEQAGPPHGGQQRGRNR